MTQNSKIDHKGYWDSNLDVQNLGQETGLNLAEELQFLDSPDQRKAFQLMSPLAEKRILEIGCGLGVNAIYLARQGATIIAMDYSGERLAELKPLLEKLGLQDRVLLVQASAEQLPFDDSVFDHAFSKSVMIHTKLDEAVAEIKRTLTDSGSGVFIEPLQKNPFVNFYRKFFAPKIWAEITNYFGKRELDCFRAIFGKLEEHRFYLFAFFAFYFQFGKRSPTCYQLFMKPLQALDASLFFVLPVLKRLAWFTVLKVDKEKSNDN